jgi:type IV pilus assembly protein PilY1
MVFHKARAFAQSIAAALLVLASAGSYADDTEIFRANPGNAAVPNLLLILDTSGSMDTNTISAVPYVRGQTYTGTGNCANINGRVYYTSGSTVPNCSSNNWFLLTDLKCQDAMSATALGAGGTGLYVGRITRWSGRTNDRRWRGLANFNANRPNSPNDANWVNPADVECRADNGVHGNGVNTSNRWPRTPSGSNSSAGVWSNQSNQSVWLENGHGSQLTLYTGNYVTYYHSPGNRIPSVLTRMDIMKDAATRLLGSLSGVNVGLMRYSRNSTDDDDGDLAAQGGMIAHEIVRIEDNRQVLIDTVNSWNPSGFTPLSETLFEAYKYFTGGTVGFGNTSEPLLSVPGSRNPATEDGANYESPADYSCQKNFIVYLTDGLPTSDAQSNADITTLPDWETLGKDCDEAGSGPEDNWPDSGLCLEALAHYMFNADMRPGTTVKSKQNVTSYWIGFGSDVTSGEAADYLNRAARAGSGNTRDAFMAEDAETLTETLLRLAGEISTESTTFTAPAVAVNAFNRTRSLSDLYVSVFQPSTQRHWPGNLKKYRVKALADGTAMVIGQRMASEEGTGESQASAIDEVSGFFQEEAHSFWSATADGPNVREGGAANELPAPGTRKVYTYIGANPSSPALLTLDASAFVDDNAAITDAMLGLATPLPDDPTPADLITWIRGADVRDQYPIGQANGNRTEQRRAMGDPVHAQPGIVIYGGTVANPSLDDAAAFLPTNDGYLHAIDTVTGEELWTFIPQEFIPLQYDLFMDNATETKGYALDGEVRTLKFDVNGDGIVTPAEGDRVILYFGMGRGGGGYYALDVTDKDAPQYMWHINSTQLPGAGQSWSAPTIARVNVNGASQNSQKLVLVLGGGYDATQDNAGYQTDTVGNRVYIVDAVTGALLWSAGLTGTDLNNARMVHSIPAAVTVLDTNSDGLSDRMYAGDTGGQVWRWDITNGNPRASLVAGSVIASVGSHDESPHVPANNRRFYNAPDVAAIQQPGGAPFLNIGIGSGYRGHPLDTTIRDRFYSIRDRNGFVALTQAQYNVLPIITENDLTDITTNLSPSMAADAIGWRLSLNQPGDTWRGEKVLGDATTINNALVFTTYTPSTTIPPDPCEPTLGTNRAYAVKVLDGSPVRVDGEADVTDRYEDFNFGGIAGDISTMVLGTDPVACTGEDCEEPCEGEDCPPPPGTTQFVCLAGVRVLDICRDFDSRVKTYWRETSAN